ncbi:hypothetical protein [endosymbiont GvMRE of Glomus versiforme]|uniref:hypothetical protein n=1 Tax=endosymbiont GvMRE of Glomus versiforme TaxID=2039283 RepID=UPI000EDF1E18|nr:hypothetical protein [endosymbiont GvMRE of Glomus versiforme]RHZ35184.1 hypothetical protein GvMRE_IIg59 [endosymbiont GvMRE of Glomus versiforme]
MVTKVELQEIKRGIKDEIYKSKRILKNKDDFIREKITKLENWAKKLDKHDIDSIDDLLGEDIGDELKETRRQIDFRIALLNREVLIDDYKQTELIIQEMMKIDEWNEASQENRDLSRKQAQNIREFGELLKGFEYKGEPLIKHELVLDDHGDVISGSFKYNLTVLKDFLNNYTFVNTQLKDAKEQTKSLQDSLNKSKQLLTNQLLDWGEEEEGNEFEIVRDIAELDEEIRELKKKLARIEEEKKLWKENAQELGKQLGELQVELNRVELNSKIIDTTNIEEATLDIIKQREQYYRDFLVKKAEAKEWLDWIVTKVGRVENEQNRDYRSETEARLQDWKDDAEKWRSSKEKIKQLPDKIGLKLDKISTFDRPKNGNLLSWAFWYEEVGKITCLKDIIFDLDEEGNLAKINENKVTELLKRQTQTAEGSTENFNQNLNNTLVQSRPNSPTQAEDPLKVAKQFWIVFIKDLKKQKEVATRQLRIQKGSDDESYWKSKIREKQSLKEVQKLAEEICSNILTTAKVNFAQTTRGILNMLAVKNRNIYEEYRKAVKAVIVTFNSNYQNWENELTELNQSKESVELAETLLGVKLSEIGYYLHNYYNLPRLFYWSVENDKIINQLPTIFKTNKQGGFIGVDEERLTQVAELVKNTNEDDVKLNEAEKQLHEKVNKNESLSGGVFFKTPEILRFWNWSEEDEKVKDKRFQEVKVQYPNLFKYLWALLDYAVHHKKSDEKIKHLEAQLSEKDIATNEKAKNKPEERISINNLRTQSDTIQDGWEIIADKADESDRYKESINELLRMVRYEKTENDVELDTDNLYFSDLRNNWPKHSNDKVVSFRVLFKARELLNSINQELKLTYKTEDNITLLDDDKINHIKQLLKLEENGDLVKQIEILTSSLKKSVEQNIKDQTKDKENEDKNIRLEEQIDQQELTIKELLTLVNDLNYELRWTISSRNRATVNNNELNEQVAELRDVLTDQNNNQIQSSDDLKNSQASEKRLWEISNILSQENSRLNKDNKKLEKQVQYLVAEKAETYDEIEENHLANWRYAELLVEKEDLEKALDDRIRERDNRPDITIEEYNRLSQENDELSKNMITLNEAMQGLEEQVQNFEQLIVDETELIDVESSYGDSESSDEETIDDKQSWTEWSKEKVDNSVKDVKRMFRNPKRTMKLATGVALKAGEVLAYAGTGYMARNYQATNSLSFNNPHQGIEPNLAHNITMEDINYLRGNLTESWNNNTRLANYYTFTQHELNQTQLINAELLKSLNSLYRTNQDKSSEITKLAENVQEKEFQIGKLVEQLKDNQQQKSWSSWALEFAGVAAFIGYNEKREEVNKLQEQIDNHNCVGCHLALHNDYNSRLIESDEFRRISAKLSGKISDSELQDLLDKIPSCSHIDYETIKQALADEREKLTKQKEHYNKEKQEVEMRIINKIITDLELSTERERENALELVIQEIRNKITPPTDDKDKVIHDLQEQMNNSKKPSTRIVNKVIESGKNINISNSEFIKKVNEACDYDELVQVYNSEVENRLEIVAQEKQNIIVLSSVLSSISIGSSIILAYRIWNISNISKKKLTAF